MRSPLEDLVGHLRHNALIRFYERTMREFADLHLKELCIDEVGPAREMSVQGRQLVNFGFDSFLGLDQDPRIQAAVAGGAREWGTQFGASRAFALPALEVRVQQKIADWMQAESAAIFPSVTLANVGALPGLVGPEDVLVLDEYAHNSMHEGAKIARSNGTRVLTFPHNSPSGLDVVLQAAQPFRGGLVAIDGVYSMSGVVAAMPELDAVARKHHCALYIDDAHATGVLGPQGRGTVLESLGSYDNAVVVGCFSKGCSIFGAFVAGGSPLVRLIKMRANSYIFGGPVPPPYLEGISTVIDLLRSDDYPDLQNRLMQNVVTVVRGLHQLGLAVLGGISPIITVLVGDETRTFEAGKFLFDRGYYVQSVTFPAVPYHAGVLRIQVNANHTSHAIDGLVAAFDELQQRFELPGPEAIAAAFESQPANSASGLQHTGLRPELLPLGSG